MASNKTGTNSAVPAPVYGGYPPGYNQPLFNVQAAGNYGYNQPQGFAPQMQGIYGPGFVQPPPMVWMTKPSVSGCPPGLEYLTQVDQLIIKQKKEIFEIMTNIQTLNRYNVFNTLGQTVYTCAEEANGFQMYFYANSRAFTMHISDNMGMEVIRVIRPQRYNCYQCCSCSKCCQDEVEIQAPVGTTAGYVMQKNDGCTIRYKIQDGNKNDVLQIKGPAYCRCTCFADIRFRVMSKDGRVEVGKITKQWSNIFQELYTNADNFGISFPMNLDVKIKAVLLGAVILIDYMFFESVRGFRR